MKRALPLPVTILLVDDNIHGMPARKVILQNEGYTVETAFSGEEAWEIYQKQTYDIVVTDFRMSGMDGVELIRLIRESNKPTRTVLLSGFVGCLGMTEKSTGADEVICKSNREVPDLLRAVKRLCTKPPKRGPVSQAGATATTNARSKAAGASRAKAV